MNRNQFIAMTKKRLARDFPTQKAACDHIGILPHQLSNAYRFVHTIPQAVLDYMGYDKIKNPVTYIKRVK